MSQIYKSLNILLVDDDFELHKIMKVLLKAAGHNLLSAYSGKETTQILIKQKPDVAILDVTMPEMDGLQVLKEIRKISDIPVLMLTAVSTSNIIQDAFLLGADDYLIKPFSAPEILERVYKLVSQDPGITESEEKYQTGSIKFSPSERKCQINGRIIELSEVEGKLLSFFMLNKDEPCSYASLIEAGWGKGGKPSNSDVEMLQLAINRLRTKIESNPDHPIYIPLMNSAGYVFIGI
jgi:DNA-binding response OmpR family regulator